MWKKKQKRIKKRYVAKKPDLISIIYLLLFCLIIIFILLKIMLGKDFAFHLLFLISFCIFAFVFYLIFPFRLINFLISQVIIYFYLRNIKKNIPSNSIVVVGQNQYKSLSFWFSPNYDIDLVFILKYLKEKGEKFSIYKNVTKDILDSIMSNKDIRTIYLVGHGRRHGFSLNSKEMIYYCIYENSKFSKDFVYQIHCNHSGGKSLVEYVVPRYNWKECLPKEGYLSNYNITEMFIDKIVQLKGYGKINGFVFKIWYSFLSLIPAVLSLIIWVLIFAMLVK